MNRTIEIVINTKGEAVVQTRGFAGASCKEASRLIEQALGTVQSDVATAEMHQAELRREDIRQH